MTVEEFFKEHEVDLTKSGASFVGDIYVYKEKAMEGVNMAKKQMAQLIIDRFADDTFITVGDVEKYCYGIIDF